MSGLSKFFGQSKKKAPTPSQAIAQLRETQEILSKQSELYEKKISEEVAFAKKNAKTNKKAALRALAKKKGYEKRLEQLDGQLNTLENQIETIEGAGMNLEVLNAMKSTSKTLRTVQKGMKVEDVHNLLDSIQEDRDVADEISLAISTPQGLGMDYDEDELDAELAALQAEDLEADLVSVPDFPEVPNSDLKMPSSSKQRAKTKEDDEAEQLAALEAWTN